MIRFSLLSIMLLITIIVGAQTYATTDNNNRVKLNPDGTWERIANNENQLRSTYIHMGNEKLKAGLPEMVHEETFGSKTFVQLAKKGARKMIIFWQEKDMQNFIDGLWAGRTILFLENGNSIELIDRNMKGQNIIKDGHESEAGSGDFVTTIKSDLYQRYSAYYLTEKECVELRRSNISSISYQTTNPIENGRLYIKFTNNKGTCKRQLLAIRN